MTQTRGRLFVIAGAMAIVGMFACLGMWTESVGVPAAVAGSMRAPDVHVVIKVGAPNDLLAPVPIDIQGTPRARTTARVLAAGDIFGFKASEVAAWNEAHPTRKIAQTSFIVKTRKPVFEDDGGLEITYYLDPLE